MLVVIVYTTCLEFSIVSLGRIATLQMSGVGGRGGGGTTTNHVEK